MSKYWLASDRDRRGIGQGLFSPRANGMDIHGAYFVTDVTIELMREFLRGLDRGVLEQRGLTKGSAGPASTN